MVPNELIIKKRSEDISYSFQFLNKQGATIKQTFKEGKNYFNSVWLLVCNEFDHIEKSKIFQRKVEDFFSRNLTKLGIENYILTFVPKRIFIEKKHKFLSALLLISPSGKFLIFCSETKSNENDFPNQIGKAEFIHFGDLLEVLSKEISRKELLKTLKKIASSLQST